MLGASRRDARRRGVNRNRSRADRLTCPGWDSNPHWTVFETAASAVGLPGRASEATRVSEPGHRSIAAFGSPLASGRLLRPTPSGRLLRAGSQPLPQPAPQGRPVHTSSSGHENLRGYPRVARATPAIPSSLATMLAFTFPGQGSQRPGMGRPWVDHDSWELVDEASEVAGRDVGSLLLDADADELKDTRNAQLTTFVSSLMVLDAVERFGIEASFCAGHSLGEYTALGGDGSARIRRGCCARRRTGGSDARGRYARAGHDGRRTRSR